MMINKKRLDFIVMCIIVLSVLSAVSYGGWVLAKKFNYYWAYQDMVEKTVCDMVKDEYLVKLCDNE